MITDGHGILHDSLTNGSKAMFFKNKLFKKFQEMPYNLKAEKPVYNGFCGIFSIHSLVRSFIHSFIIWSFIWFSKLNSYLVLLGVSNELKLKKKQYLGKYY